MSLLSDNLKTSLGDALTRVHDTMARTIAVYVDEASASGSGFGDTSYNPLYKRSVVAKTSSQNVLVKYEYSARIFYGAQNEDTTSTANLPNSNGVVRIKVSSDAMEKIKICSRIEVDGDLFVRNSDFKCEDQINRNYFSCWLKREN